MYVIIFLLLCSVINSKQTEWVKLPEIELKDTIKPNTDFEVVKFAYNNSKNVTLVNKNNNNVTKNNFSYLDNLSQMFLTNNNKKNQKVVKNYTIATNFNIVTMKPHHKINTTPRHGHVIKVDKITLNTPFESIVITPIKKTDFNNQKLNLTLNNEQTNNTTATDNNKNEYFNIKYIANIITNIQKNIFTKIPKTINSKLKFLENIKNTILNYLDKQMGIMWIKDNNRQKRGTKDDDSHLDFPSSESALMTIGFLTFSVFLIKLVMQLVHVLKAKKTYSITPMTAVGRNFGKSNEKSHNENTMRILKLMEDFENK